jgi:hypothetical protein
MDKRIRHLREDFLLAAASAVGALRQSGIELPESNMAWATCGIPMTGELTGGGSYRKHGYGCEVRINGLEVDFDFDEGGQIKEPDAFRLVGFCGKRFEEYGFSSEQDLARAISGGV